MPSTASSSAVPVRTDSISKVPSFRFSPATGQPSFHSSGRISSTLAPPLSRSASQCIENFCTPSPRSRRPKWPAPNHTTAGTHEQLSAALDHIDALIVEERAGDFLRAAHADVVAGVGAAAATAVRGQQVIPAIVIDHVGRFAVDGEVARFVIRVFALTGLGIELDQPDVAEIRAIDQPQPAVGGIQKDARVDGIAVFDAVRRGDHAALFPLVVGGIRVEGLVRDHVDGGFGLRPDIRGDIHVVAVAEVNDIGGQAAARERGAAFPGPAVIGNQRPTARAVGVELAVAQRDGGGVVDPELAVQRQRQRSQRENGCQKCVFHLNPLLQQRSRALTWTGAEVWRRERSNLPADRTPAACWSCRPVGKSRGTFCVTLPVAAHSVPRW